MSVITKDLGAATAYGYAVEKGYTGTEAEFAELMADYAEVGQRAEDAAESALNSKTAAQTAATTATHKASEATTAAQTATTKAGEAQTSAQTASSKASEASQSASQASGYAQTAETAKTDAQTAKTQAETARDEAVTAKTAAETAQAAAESVAESIPSDYSQLSEDVSDLKEDLTQEIERAEAEEERLEALFTAPTQEAVDNWLDAHPEATTTVQDGAITRAKLNSTIQHGINGNDYWFSSDGTASDFIDLVESGTYKNIYVDGSVSLTFDEAIEPAAGTVIYGNGATFKRAAGYTDLLFNLDDDCELHNVVIDGNKDNVTNGNWSRTVDLHIAGNNVLIDNIKLQNGCEAIMVVGSDCVIQNSTIIDCRGNGIHMGQAYRTIIKHNHIANTNLDEMLTNFNNGYGCIYFCRIVHDTVIDGNYLYNGGCGIYGLNTDGTLDNVNVKVVNNTIVDPRRNAIDGTYQASADDVSAKRIIISGNTMINTTANDVRVFFGNTASTTYRSTMELIIANNILVGVRLIVHNCVFAIIKGNYQKSAGAMGLNYCSSIVISSNIIDSTASALAIEGGTTDSIVANNCIKSGLYPLYISSDSYKNCICDNTIESTSTTVSYNVNPAQGCQVLGNRIKFAGGVGIQSTSKYVIIKDNILIASNSGLTAIKVWGGSDNLIIADNACNENASYSFGSTMTTGRIDNNYVMTGLI